MTAFLRSYALIICFSLALAITCLLGSYLISEQAMPFGDGQYYASRAFALYGYLHTGQWGKFWDLFTSPRETIAPFHYWIFFLLPQAWAGMATYAAIQLLSTYLLLAVAVWKLCKTLDRMEWAPALFLLCSVQTFTLDYAYSFFIDMPFCAMGILTLAWQIQAWREPSFNRRILSGVGAGLLFWIKPANALLFLVTYLLTEAIYAIIRICRPQAGETSKNILLSSFAHFTGLFTGFVPVTLLALLCGAGQTILFLINNNEVVQIPAKIECTGLLRLFYFPLCLTYFYHTTALVIILGVVIGGVYFIKTKGAQISLEPFPLKWLIPAAIAYFVFGEFFSFVIYGKTLRCLLLVLPIIWLVAFWCFEKWCVQSSTLFIASLIYASTVFSHLFFNTLGLSPAIVEDYQLNDNWLTVSPQSWNTIPVTIALNNEVCGSVKKYLPQGGKVSVNTKKFYFNNKCIYWGVNHESLLHSQTEPYHLTTIFTDDGEYYQSSLINSNMLILLTVPNFQTDQVTFDNTKKLFEYSANQWRTQDKIANIAYLPLYPNMALGYEVIFKEPLTETQVKTAMQAVAGVEVAYDDQGNGVEELYGHRYSWPEVWQILWAWKVKRFG